MNTPIFCYQTTSADELMSLLRQTLESLPFDCTSNVIEPAESVTDSEYSLSQRANILLRVYRQDYHTDSFDFERLARRMHTYDECIWFWGSEEQVARYRLNNKAQNKVEDLALGTVSLLNGETEFGIGVGELCRSGSMDFEIGGKAYMLNRQLRYMSEPSSVLSEKYHAKVLVPRNCTTTDEIRGGEAVHTLHKKYLRSMFWGFAPWYVMQGGRLEMLDFRQCNRDPDDVVKGIESAKPWLFSNNAEADFAAAMCRMNIGFSPEMEILESDLKGSCELLGELHLPEDKETERQNHGILIVSSEGNVLAKDGLISLNQSNTCCKIVRLELDNPQHHALQTTLHELGYQLTSILPAKHTSIVRDGAYLPLQIPAYGFWSLPNKSFVTAFPYYARHSSNNEDEKIVLDYLNERLCNLFDVVV